ncbi:hypothetical protein ACPC37_14360 [Streptomyces griseoincarnatus]
MRINRLRHSSGRYFVTVLDDGLVSGPSRATADLRPLISTVERSGCPAVMAYPGFFRHHLSWHSPLARIVNVTASTELGGVTAKSLVFDPLEAVRCSAEAVAVHVSLGTTDEGRMLANLADAITGAHSLGIPVLAAAYARDPAGLPLMDGAKQAHAARCVVELGADLVKSPWPGDAVGMAKVVDAAWPVPVLLAGGPPGSDEETVRMVRSSQEAGGAGVCFGRRLLASPDTAALTERIAEVLSGS